MRMKLYILFLIFLSCNKSTETIKVLDDLKLTNFEQRQREDIERSKKFKQEEQKDSLNLDKILKEALRTASQNINIDKFNYIYDIERDSLPVKVEINSDYHFSLTSPHLVIRRASPKDIYIDIYHKSYNKFNKILSHQEWTLTYVNDTIRDINGDGIKDFIVNSYGASGCCLKASSSVYLLDANTNNFSKDFFFINPTFSPSEKTIRGICYGHPGETEMYKYKWTMGSIDTIEYVSYEIDNEGKKTGKILISNKEPFHKDFKILKHLKKIPSEYTKIEGYDWFVGFKE